MNAIDRKLELFPRRRYSLLPTPVHEIPVFLEMFGLHVYCKRDDLTGFGFGGNKSRKLDFLIAEALDQGCDTLLAVGANQSNFCRMVAAYGSASGMQVHLLLGGREPPTPTGNLLIDHMLDARRHHMDSSDWHAWEEEARSLEQRLIKSGRKVYRMPIGGSTPVGALGCVQAMSEIIDDEVRLGLQFDYIVLASGSGGTQAGLLTGKSIAGWPGKIIGMSVAKDSSAQSLDISKLATDTAKLLETTAVTDTIVVDDSYIGDGYGCRTPACEEAVGFFARRCGIFLDHVYTGKAAAGLIDYLRTGRFDIGSRVLFLHTGGNVELFE